RCASIDGDPFRFLTGGGDIEHAWCFSGDFHGIDPYYPINVALTKRVMTVLGEEKRERKNLRSGYDAPLVLHAMGDGAIACGTAAGIDVFIAAKFVGANGKAIGVDMTDRMLSVARENQPRVASALGYDAVEFREGFLEQIPIDSKSADLVTSNCVVNLSPDKPRVFAEVWRVLKDHGRILISDIVAEREVPAHLKVNAQLWGECL